MDADADAGVGGGGGVKLGFTGVYVVKLGFTGVYIIFLFSAQNIYCAYSLEPHRQCCSNEYPQSMF